MKDITTTIGNPYKCLNHIGNCKNRKQFDLEAEERTDLENWILLSEEQEYCR